MTLIERLESAEAGSRELNLRVMAHLHPQYKLEDRGHDELYLWNGGECVASGRTADPVTTDLSAAVALVERAAPDKRIIWNQQRDGNHLFGLIPRDRSSDVMFWNEHATHADKCVALCIALLRAIEAKTQQTNQESQQ